ncbi:NAD(P)-dependent alcohol dehydrogenase [Fertoebacter nigrum]|uniref:NAD(P)-dependent alcohol dehydrogenase n=1 Tax=Fertoeibacter niger TaxID=2656921 RepID=A0A8X8H6C2_9RHOB|nr:NAD(P)-dependent alcohol dehydrogenase [Fertoeibacter niger]NUB43951.1 NAD(P)-dependent alcohol dehydrogenase [Fertoeibacter niger]
MTSARMRHVTAACATAYGPPEVVVLRQIAAAPLGDDDLRIAVHHTTVSSADVRIRGMRAPRGFGLMMRLIFGITRPRQPVLGTELSGIVTEVGRKVTRFRPGEAVFAFPGGRMGAHAASVVMPQTGRVRPVPAGVALDDAAALCFGGTTALGYLRDKLALKPGESLLVVGASGAVGTAAVQIGRDMGARVTGVCSAGNAELVLALGAERVIDYQSQDIARLPDRYDAILDTTGLMAWASHRHLLTPEGRLALVVASLPQMLAALRAGKRVVMGPAPETTEAMEALAAMAARGAFRPVIGHRLPFDQIAAAHALVDTGHKRGSVLITLPVADGMATA